MSGQGHSPPSVDKSLQEPQVNCTYFVEKSEGLKEIPATVIHKGHRCPDGSKIKELMYYVHYEQTDRRHDEWVRREKINMDKKCVNDAMASGEAAEKDGESSGIRKRGAMTRSVRKQLEESGQVAVDPMANMTAVEAMLEKEHQERTKVKNIPKITIGAYKITCWYYSPFPKECTNFEMFMCEYCLMYTPEEAIMMNHMRVCRVRQPPGNEIYRKDNLYLYEVDGSLQKMYCQCLCLYSKLFLDHKSLSFDVDHFYFYVLCEVDIEVGAHIVGYYSREIDSTNNLSCIMVFPPFQKKSYGKLLIQLSYEMSEREGYAGTPERPLSDMGKATYQSYWWWRITELLSGLEGTEVTPSSLSTLSWIAVDDVIDTLQQMKVLKPVNRGRMSILRQVSFTVTQKLINYCQKGQKVPRLMLDKSLLSWRPAMTRPEYERQQKLARAKRQSSSDITSGPLVLSPRDVQSTSSEPDSPENEDVPPVKKSMVFKTVKSSGSRQCLNVSNASE